MDFRRANTIEVDIPIPKEATVLPNHGPRHNY